MRGSKHFETFPMAGLQMSAEQLDNMLYRETTRCAAILPATYLSLCVSFPSFTGLKRQNTSLVAFPYQCSGHLAEQQVLHIAPANMGFKLVYFIDHEMLKT